MSTKRKTYSAEFKAKIVLEVLEGNETLNQIATKYELLAANLTSGDIIVWCAEGDLNPHTRRHNDLNVACLPFHHLRI